jgi:hypothetical protein
MPNVAPTLFVAKEPASEWDLELGERELCNPALNFLAISVADQRRKIVPVDSILKLFGQDLRQGLDSPAAHYGIH